MFLRSDGKKQMAGFIPVLKKFLEVRSFLYEALRKKNGKTVFPDHTGGNARARLGETRLCIRLR